MVLDVDQRCSETQLAVLQRLTSAMAAAAGAMTTAPVRPRHLRAAAAHALVRELLRRHLHTRGHRCESLLPMDGGADAGLAEAQQRVERLRLPDDLPPHGLPPRQLGHLYAELLHHGTRKAQGAWYTGAGLTQPTAARTLQPLLDGDALGLRICDPAVGSGEFLLAALDQLATATDAPRADIGSRCLYGLDIDPTAAALAAWTLWDACAAPDLPIAAIAAHVRHGDGLAAPGSGDFDAVLGNPPWETLQPSRMEHFSDLVDGYRELGHQQALLSQQELFARDPAAAPDWAAMQRRFGVRARQLRARFRHQGRGKLFTYRLFLEQSFAMLRDGGRLGLVLPASLCFDRDAAPLRRLLFEHCQWEWLFMFENRSGLFAIDSRYRFGPIIAQKGGHTVAVRAAFGRRDVAEWQAAAPEHLPYPRTLVQRLSPRHGVLLELQDHRDLELLRLLHDRGEPLVGRGDGALRFAQGDFNLTSGSHHFTPAAVLTAQGARADADGLWRLPDGTAFAPLYQGAMIYDLHPHVADYAGGGGHRTRWMAPRQVHVLQPQFFIAVDELARRRPLPVARVGFRTLSNATNERTVVACLLGSLPCGNSLGLLSAATGTPVLDCAFATGVAGSLVFDWAMRQRLAGTNLNRFVLEESVWPVCDAPARQAIARLTLRLSAIMPWQEPIWQAARDEGWLEPGCGMHTHAAHAEPERRRLRLALDVAVARAFGLGADLLAWMLRGCDLPAAAIRRGGGDRDRKGFWRIDRDLAPADRHPVRVLAAMRSEQGLQV